MKRICVYCDSPFEPKKPKQIFCSTKCRVYNNRGSMPEGGFVYCLRNPLDNNSIFYVGRTLVSINERLSGHLSDKSAPKSKKTSVIKSILEAGEEVIIEQLETIHGDSVEEIDAKLSDREKHWIRELAKENKLANKAHNANNKTPNKAVTLYLDRSVIAKFGGREGARIAIYQFLDGSISKTGETGFLPLDLPDPKKKFPPSDREIKQKVVKEEKRPVVTDLTKPTGVLEPHQQPKTNFSINTKPKTLDELKSLCPFPERSNERSEWVRTERQKYGI